MISADRIITIVSPESAPIKRLVQEARDSGRAIDATYGRKTRAVVIMDSGHIIACNLVADILNQTCFKTILELCSFKKYDVSKISRA